MSFWAHIVQADVKVVGETYVCTKNCGNIFLQQGYAVPPTCPSGYVVTGCIGGTVEMYQTGCFGENGCDNHWKFNPSTPNSNNNPTSCSYGKAICAKVCN